jgi:hypothetical protein
MFGVFAHRGRGGGRIGHYRDLVGGASGCFGEAGVAEQCFGESTTSSPTASTSVRDGSCRVCPVPGAEDA